jgi:hypothetical protein
MFGILPLADTGMHGAHSLRQYILTLVYVGAVPVQIILYGIVVYSSNIHTLFHTVSFIPYRYTYAFCNIHPGALDRL